MNLQLWRVFIFGLVVLCASCSGDKNKNESEGATKTAGHASDASIPDNTAATGTVDEDLAAAVDQIVAGAAKLPRVDFDPATLARMLGKDPKAHFEWVRDHTWWAPYRGLLRGSKGVMLDRVGSNLDRAVLLGDLLRLSGHTVRLAHAQLSESRAKEVLSKVRPIPDHRSNPESDALGSSSVEREARAQVLASAKQLYAAVRNATAPNSPPGDHQALAAIADHWWVERLENGEWVPMDPLLPDATMGSTLVAAAGVNEWKAADRMPAVPESEWHTVQLSVVVERYEGGNTAESKVLETTLRPAITFDRPITLAHFPKPWPESLPDAATDPNARGNAAASVREWIPFLRIGDEIIYQSGFNDGGEPIDDPLGSKHDIAAVGGGGFMSGFGAALGGGGGETTASSMTAEWIDYEIRVPGESPQLLRREVFDLLGPALRQEKVAEFDASTNDRLVARYQALLSQTDILLQPCDFTGGFVADLKSAGIVAKQAAIKELARTTDPSEARGKASAILGGIDLWGPLLNLTLWRASLAATPRDSFIDRPNVLNYRAILPVVSADTMGARELVDVASNSTGVRRGAPRNEFEIRVEQGVADTVAEILTISSDLRAVENTASVFSIANGSSGGIKVFKAGSPGEVKDLGFPKDTGARLVATIESGYMAVAPTQLVQLRDRQAIGWWRVDPESGETIGVMDTGFHVALTEEETTELNQTRRTLSNWQINEYDRMEAVRSRVLRGRPVDPQALADLKFYDLVVEVIGKLVGLGA